MAVNGVDNVYSYLNSQYSSINKETEKDTENKDSGELAMSDFMSLMTTQLMNQDPLKPMESGDFLGQIASFSTVSGIADLQESFASFSKAMQSDQALQGSSLVGRSVLIPSSIGMLDENGMRGQINVAEPVTDLKLTIYDETGSIVRTMNIGEASGYTSFEWDGLDDSGEALPAGGYQFVASGTASGANTAFGTAVIAKVDSVLVGNGNGLSINLAGIGSVPFSEVQEII